MKHRLVKKLKSENKILKAKIRGLKNKKPERLNSTSLCEYDQINIDALIKHFKLNKYVH